jgi:hypothetical protein
VAVVPPREFVADGESGVDAGGAPELLEAPPPCSSVAVDNGAGLVLAPEPVACAVVVPTGGWDWGGAG